MGSLESLRTVVLQVTQLGRECGPRAVVLRLKHRLEHVYKCRQTSPTAETDSAVLEICILANSPDSDDSDLGAWMSPALRHTGLWCPLLSDLSCLGSVTAEPCTLAIREQQ